MADTIFFALYLLSLLVLGLFGVHKYFLLSIYKKYKNHPIPKPPDPEIWPDVTVQLPIFNERYVVKRLIRSCVCLDYPKDKLHIQILDDSNDMTVKLVSRLVKVLKNKGFRIDHVRRPDRVGFKAGALAYGLENTDSEFIAIFDADFVPDSDFLKKSVPYIMQEGIGMIQTRWGHINRGYSMLTQLQAIFLDAHFMIEHVARNRSGRFFNFNGTAGMWRKQAIIDAGGWQHDTLTEDLDLSYRSQLAGWKFTYLPDVIAPAELPAEMNAYKNQQHRWAKGSVQTGLKLIPRIWRSDFPLFIRMEAIIHLCNNFAYLLMAIPALLLVPVVKIQVGIEEVPWKLVFVYLTVFLSATVSVIIYYARTIKETRGSYWPGIIYLPALMGLGIGMSLNNGRAAVEAILRKQSDFIRTPKFMLEGRKGTWRKKFYRPAKSFQPFIELLIGGYFTWGWLYFASQEVYYAMPFFLLFIFGFYYIGILSMSSLRR